MASRGSDLLNENARGAPRSLLMCCAGVINLVRVKVSLSSVVRPRLVSVNERESAERDYFHSGSIVCVCTLQSWKEIIRNVYTFSRSTQSVMFSRFLFPKLLMSFTIPLTPAAKLSESHIVGIARVIASYRIARTVVPFSSFFLLVLISRGVSIYPWRGEKLVSRDFFSARPTFRPICEAI